MRRVLGLFLLLGFGLAQPTLYFLNWADYVPDSVIRAFEKREKARVVLDTFESPEAMLAKLRAGADREYSLVVAPDYYVLQMARLGLLAPLDKARLPNLKNLDPAFHNPPYDPGGKYSVPYQWGTTGIGYREDLVKGKVDSYAVFFDPRRQAGPFLLLDEMRETTGAALRYLGYSVSTTDPKALERAKILLINAKRRSLGFAGGGGGYQPHPRRGCRAFFGLLGGCPPGPEGGQAPEVRPAQGGGDALDGRPGPPEEGACPGASL